MASAKIPALIALVFCSCILYCSAQADSNLTAYTVLEQYGFPAGLLPTSVKGYTLNEDGSFEIYFEGSCSFSLESGYSLKYKERITGHLSTGSLKDLKGVSVKVLFFWLTIDGIVREGDSLEFSVGVVSASFPVDNFIECPHCGCGLDCNGLLRAEA
ncbi:hypothetical protein SUGI_0135670 [Cryptomeria japonica]|uniref:uncharacterized protein LOC131044657 n=1 Tax=Cryptomeria japonica TaxID=3369 RepID=UPI002408AF5B|nr:uncharacterized protein LOC131044657 [Cryptomeria japonica]GLJ10815.1 hypothetical protein SUGI_0135670 [Cryptomeria japonica]